MICPECNGNKKNKVLVCPPGDLRDIDCSLCGGVGSISPQQAEWVEQGKAMREERLSRDMSLNEEAKRLGVSPFQLSQMERGKIDSRPTPRAADACPECGGKGAVWAANWGPDVCSYCDGTGKRR